MTESPLMIKSKELALEVVAFERQQIFLEKRQNKKMQFPDFGVLTGIGLGKDSIA